MNKLVIGLGALVLILATALVTVLATGMMNKGAPPPAEAAAPAEKPNPFAEAKYFELKPEFVVNFGPKARPRYMMIDVSVSTKDDKAIEALKKHMPVVRDKLLSLFGDQNAAALQSSEVKEKLRGETLACIQDVMKERYGSPAIDEVFFTRFVTQ